MTQSSPVSFLNIFFLGEAFKFNIYDFYYPPEKLQRYLSSFFLIKENFLDDTILSPVNIASQQKNS